LEVLEQSAGQNDFLYTLRLENNHQPHPSWSHGWLRIDVRNQNANNDAHGYARGCKIKEGKEGKQMKYGYQFQIHAIPGNENYETFLKYAKMMLVKVKEEQGHADATIKYQTQQSYIWVQIKRFKYLPMWGKFLTLEVQEPVTNVSAEWEV
jgi:hypothetical protein